MKTQIMNSIQIHNRCTNIQNDNDNVSKSNRVTDLFFGFIHIGAVLGRNYRRVNRSSVSFLFLRPEPKEMFQQMIENQWNSHTKNPFEEIVIARVHSQ